MTAPSHTEMLNSLRTQFRRQFGDTHGLQLAMAPGRVNLLGDHTDYNDGFVLPMTVDRGVYIAVRERDDSTVRLYSVLYDELLEYPLDEFIAPRPGGWPSYVVGVVQELRLRGLVETGFEAVIDGNLALGAGLSSSAALEVATATALQHLLGFELGAVDMVRLCQHVEHDYANVLCGIMDQFASRLGRKDHALFLDCRSLDYRNVPVDLGEHRLVIVSSAVERALAASAYNMRRAECREAVGFFSGIDPDIRALRDVSAEMLGTHGRELSPEIHRRCRHVISENRRVLEAVECLAEGRLDDFGALMFASHGSLRDDYQVSCAELDALVAIAGDCAGVLGARMTGAGFGGCTVNLVQAAAIPTFVERLSADYKAHFNLEPGVFVLQGNLEAGPVSPTVTWPRN